MIDIDVSVIIVTYNTLQMTKECIDSIFSKTQDVFIEVILVDNSSTDGSKEFFEKDNRITYVYSKENLGFGRGNNLGYTRASGKYIFLLNSDTLLTNNAIKIFYDWMEKQPNEIGCCGTLLMDYKGQPMHSSGDKQSFAYFFNHIKSSYRLPTKKFNRPRDTDVYPRKVYYITGADLFIRRNVIEECGLFDEDFFMYYEESEMQCRYHRHGYESWIIREPGIIHLAGKSAKKPTTRTISRFIGQIRSRYLYLEKTHSFIPRYLIYLMHLLLIPGYLLKEYPKAEKNELYRILFLPFHSQVTRMYLYNHKS